MPAPLLLIDASSLAYRAYHAIPELLAPDGTPVNAVHGFLNFLARLVGDRAPRGVAVALDDDWRPAFRVDALPSYKAHRVEQAGADKDTVEPQVRLIVEVLDAVGIAIASAAGYEAEDAIAALTTRERPPMEIVTGDRDLFALVRDPDVKVLYTLRGVTELAHVDEAYITKTYGIPGTSYLDFAILRGDPSDGLPGVRGIGEKSAAALVAKYGRLEQMLGAWDLSPTIAAKLRAGADYLAAAMRVVAPQRDCPVRLTRDVALPRVAAQPDLLQALAEKYRLGGPVDRVLKALGTRERGE